MFVYVRLLQDWGYATHKRCVGVALERESHNDYYKVYQIKCTRASDTTKRLVRIQYQSNPLRLVITLLRERLSVRAGICV
jgi:hypothetical protein